jgi:thiol-disulfide isomerase/thioredoxin
MQQRLITFLYALGLSFTVTAQSIPTIDYADLQQYMQQQGDTTVVYNFWATWCRPCVAELPYFLQLDSAYVGQPVKVVLVSLDFPDQKDRLEAFVQRKGIQPEVLHLDEANQDAMINGIDPTWTGAIPATLVLGPHGRAFHEGSFTYEALSQWITSLLP